jgi:hypothetical protein
MTTIARYLQRHYWGDVDPARWADTIGLPESALCRRALAGDALARALVRVSAVTRWQDATGDFESAPPLEAVALDARKHRRRAWRRGRRP